MQQEEDNRRSESSSGHMTPEKLQATPRDGGSYRRDSISRSHELKRRVHCTPKNSPNKYSKTPQSSASFRRDALKSQLDSNKRKVQSSHKESLEKIQKTGQSGKFVNALIGKWSKHMGMQTPLSQTGKVQESPMTEEMKRKNAVEERKIQKLQKQLQAAEETISSLSASHEAELKAKEEILQQLNGDWESITKYYYEISESLKEFQQHKDNLSKLYNDVIIMQQSTVKKLQEDLNTMRLKDEEQKNAVAAIENKAVNHEKRIQEMIIVEKELNKRLEDTKKKSLLEKEQLHSIHAEEKLELIKEQDKLTSMNKDLQVQLEKVIEEKQNLTNSFVEKDKEISKLQDEIVVCKNKVQDLLYQNTELNLKYEESLHKEEELKTELESKFQEVKRLHENLNTRQEIESSLTKDLTMIDNRYKIMEDDFSNLKNKLTETQIRNSNLEISLENIKHSNQQKIMELNKTIEHLECEKKKILSEKHLKIEELQNTCKLLREKHEREILSLKDEFEVKLVEMKKTIETQSLAFNKLNETLNNVNEENQIKEKHCHTKENRNKLQDGLKECSQSIIGSNTSQMEVGKSHEAKEQQFQEHVSIPKVSSRNKNEISDQRQQDIYNFNTKEADSTLQNISPMKQNKFNLSSSFKVSDYLEDHSYLHQGKNVSQLRTELQETNKKIKEDQIDVTPKKKIFKTRNTGITHYGTRQIFKK